MFQKKNNHEPSDKKTYSILVFRLLGTTCVFQLQTIHLKVISVRTCGDGYRLHRAPYFFRGIKLPCGCWNTYYISLDTLFPECSPNLWYRIPLEIKSIYPVYRGYVWRPNYRYVSWLKYAPIVFVREQKSRKTTRSEEHSTHE